MTEITIDGDPSDWADYPLTKDEPLGDSEGGVLDFGGLYLFRNRDAVYLMVELADGQDDFEALSFMFTQADRFQHVYWDGSSRNGDLATESLDYQDFTDLGSTGYSAIVLADVLEARIDLRDLGDPDELALNVVNVHTSECCTPPERHPADSIEQIGGIPLIDEVDPPELLARVPSFVLEDWMQLPGGWYVERLLSPPLSDINQFTKSRDGTTFVELGLFTGSIVTIDPQSGQVNMVLGLLWDPSRTTGIAGEPGDSVFVVVRNEIWQVSSDGSHEVWCTVLHGEGTHPTYYTDRGHLIGWKHANPTYVVEILPDGTAEQFAVNLPVDSWRVSVDAAGDVYINTPSEIYRLYQ